MALIYILDADPARAAALAGALQPLDHAVRAYQVPHEFFRHVSRMPPRCAIVSMNLPEINGLDVVRRLRLQVGGRMGVVIAADVDCEASAIDALREGADDYVARPVAQALMVMRVHALLRRLSPGPAAGGKQVRLGPYSIDVNTQLVHLDGSHVDLAPREFDLAWVLFSQPSRLFTKAELLATIWGRNSTVSEHTIAQHVHSLRKKLKLSEHGVRLHSVYGSGYRLEYVGPSASRRADAEASARGMPADHALGF